MRGIITRIGRPQSRVLGVWHLTDRLAISLEWKLADLWIGCYVYTHPIVGTAGEETNVYLIGIPTLVLHIAWITY